MRSVWWLLGLVACGSEPECLEALGACDPLYEPTFDNVHANTLAVSCALGGCHDAQTSRGGLDMSTVGSAYAGLVDEGRVLPGDAECSEVVIRLHADDGLAMPPGSPLSDAEICAVQQWVAEGAAR